MINEYNQYLHRQLNRIGFIPGTELTALLQKKFNLGSDNARKIIQRAAASGVIDSTKPITFGKGQFIYMLPGNYITFESIKVILQRYRPPLYRILDIMDRCGGIISYYEAIKLSASPEQKTSTKASTVDELVNLLIKLDLVKIKTDNYGIKYLVDPVWAENGDLLTKHYSQMLLDCIFIPDILRWLQKVHFIDNLKTIYRRKQNPSIGAEQNSLLWDAFGYTKNVGFNEMPGVQATTIEKQTLVVMDIMFSREYSQSDLDGFLGRVQVNQNAVKTGKRKILPIVFYKEISDAVRYKLMALGFLAFDIGTVFGNRIKSIVALIGTVQKQLKTKPDEVDSRTIEQLLSVLTNSGQEDNLANLKGILFEFLLYPVIRTFYSNATINHGVTYSKKTESGKVGYEYDFVIKSENPKEIVIIEAKGYLSDSRISLGHSDTPNTLKWFYGRTFPFIKSFFAKELAEGYKLKACYITSANYLEDGHTFLQSQSKFKPRHLEGYYDGNSLMQLLKENEFKQIAKTMERYFIHNHSKELKGHDLPF